jgi:hypothetical protein
MIRNRHPGRSEAETRDRAFCFVEVPKALSRVKPGMTMKL